MKKGTVNFAAGMLASALLFGGGAACAAGVMAEKSTSAVYVDGQRVELEAYNIYGSNYVKLRDVGKAVNFNVYWDGAVQIDTTAPYTGEAQPVTAATVQLPTDGGKYTPRTGDRILCDDGTIYEVKDVTRFENNVFAPDFDPALPEPTCDWSRFPTLELPRVDVRHFSDAAGDDLFIRNLYETRRMVYTLYNALGQELAAWRDGKLLAKISATIPAEDEAYTWHFWPWRSSEIEKHVRNLPNGRFKVEAFDYFHDGNFMETRYFICTA